jgi:hypothetical protein
VRPSHCCALFATEPPPRRNALAEVAIQAIRRVPTTVPGMNAVLEDVASAAGTIKISAAIQAIQATRGTQDIHAAMEVTEVITTSDMEVVPHPTAAADTAIEVCGVIDERTVPAARQSPLRLHLPVAVLRQTVVEPCPAVR